MEMGLWYLNPARSLNKLLPLVVCFGVSKWPLIMKVLIIVCLMCAMPLNWIYGWNKIA